MNSEVSTPAGEESFAALFEASLQDRTEVREGEVVKGTIIEVREDNVLVDIGYKSEATIALSEFRMVEGQYSINVGDTVDVFVESREDDSGLVIVSKEKADKLRVWDDISEAAERNETVRGAIIARVKGGLSVDIGVKAFLPGSQVDLRPVRNLDKLLGETFDFRIIKFNKRRGNIVLSRRVLLEQERDELKKDTLKRISEGEVLVGVVKNLTEYGAFVDLGGIDGLLHITDMSWGRINHPSELFEVGQEIDVKVLSYDESRQRVSLGFKQLQEDPWLEAAKKYVVGDRTQGQIVSLTDYGAFVELENGVEGLIHVSEMSWSKRVKHPSKIVTVGQEVEIVVLAIDQENRRISLGMKQIEPNPWDVVKEQYQIGDVISAGIRNITDFGIFVEIAEGIDGLIHISDISWTERVKHPGDNYKKGDQVEAKVLQIDPETERFSLGIKQLTEDPWVQAATDLPVGSKGNGKITKLAEFGAFVEIAPGVEGMIHVSEISDDNVAHPSDVLKEGQSVDFIVLSSDSDARKFSLSIKALEQNLEGEALQQYIGSVQPTTSLADAFAKARGDDKIPTPEEVIRMASEQDED